MVFGGFFGGVWRGGMFGCTSRTFLVLDSETAFIDGLRNAISPINSWSAVFAKCLVRGKGHKFVEVFNSTQH